MYTLSFAVTMEKMAHCKRRGRDPGWEMWSEFTIWGYLSSIYHPFMAIFGASPSLLHCIVRSEERI